MPRSPSIKILQAPASERELRQNQNEAIADYKERIMYERIMRDRPQQKLVGAVRVHLNAPGSTVRRTLVSPQGFLIPVVSVPSDFECKDYPVDDDDDDDDEGIFYFDL